MSGKGVSQKNEAEDLVNKPSHYQTPSGIQPVDVVEMFDLPHHVGDAVIYLLRLGKKKTEPVEQEMRKAIWWLVRHAKIYLGVVITADQEGNVTIAATAPKDPKHE